jgi:oligoribonuclease
MPLANAAAVVRRNMNTSMPAGASRSSITVAAGFAAITGSSDSAIAGDGNALRSVHLVLVWMDLEMTGLDPGRHVIVEIATLITDDDLTIVAEGPDLVVHQDEAALAEMDPVVVDMHTRSGLLNAIRASSLTLADAGAQTLEFIQAHVTEARRVPLCGNSIGMDRRFLAAYLPEIEEYLHYRSVDVSTIKELVKRWYPALNGSRPRKTGTHRALDDIRESIAELTFYREHVFVRDSAEPVAAADSVTAHSPESS